MNFFLTAVAAATQPNPIQEPLLTWNLFLTAFLVPLSLIILGSWMKRQFEKRDKNDERIASLLEEREARKDDVYRERWDGLQKTMCLVKEKVEDISEKMHERVPFSVCDEREREIHKRLDNHDGRLRMGKL